MTIITGDCLEVMRTMADNSISAIVCDPPYFLTNKCGSGFMGKSWDSIHDLEKYVWESSSFVDFAINFLNAMTLDSNMEEASIAQENANMLLSPHGKELNESVLPVKQLLPSPNARKSGSARLLVITKQERSELLKELSPSHIKLIEAYESGGKESVLFVLPILLLEKEVNRIAQDIVLKGLIAKDAEEREIHLTLMDQIKIENAIEAMIGMKLESSFIGETIGNANIASSSVPGSRFNVITLSHIERGELMKWLTLLLCAINAIRQSKTIQNYLIDNFFRVTFAEAMRICKPGSYLLAFSGTRTHHKLASAIESIGWEIRDTIYWNYGSGFPKSHNHFGLEGYGTALKPAVEPCLMAMKPLDGTFKQNAEKWGQAGINIDACRIATIENVTNHSRSLESSASKGIYGDSSPQKTHQTEGQKKGRWPANVLLDEEAARLLDEQTGVLKSGELKPYKSSCDLKSRGWGFSPDRNYTCDSNSGGASRFFYCAKASSSERNEGLDCYITVKYDIDKKRNLCLEENMAAVELLKRDIYGLTEHLNIDVYGESITAQFLKDFSSIIKMKIKQIIESKTLNLSTLSPTNEFIRDVENWMEIGSSHVVNVALKKMFQLLITNGKMVSALGVSNAALKMLSIIKDEGNWKEKRSTHPTVKPLKLMEYLIKLVMPPKDGILLDPFAGSGTTILAAHRLGLKAIGIEKQPEYAEIAKARLEHAISQKNANLSLFDEKSQ